MAVAAENSLAGRLTAENAVIGAMLIDETTVSPILAAVNASPTTGSTGLVERAVTASPAGVEEAVTSMFQLMRILPESPSTMARKYSPGVQSALTSPVKVTRFDSPPARV